MKNKQKVLKILDKHRDMSLTAGCEVKELYIGTDGEVHYRSDFGTVVCWRGVRIVMADTSGVTHPYAEDVLRDTKKYKILGHPATPLTLLKALEANYKPIKGRRETRTYHINGTYTVAFVDDITKESGVYEIKIPDVTTLTELPHTHKLWTDLLPILS